MIGQTLYQYYQENDLDYFPEPEVLALSVNSPKKSYFVCLNQHKWIMPIRDVARTARGCPTCSGIEFTYPDVWQQWVIERNGIPNKPVQAGSNKKVWWRCSSYSDHLWEDRIADRTLNKYECKICSGKQILVGFNDFRFKHPELAIQWHPEKNDITPEEVTTGTAKKVWWQCSINKTHSWQSSPRTRVRGSGCPYCSRYSPDVGVTNLATTHPILLKEWDYLHNTLTPNEVTSGSEKKIKWVCSLGHRWTASVFNRTKEQGTQCPECCSTSTSKIEQAYRDILATTLLAEVPNTHRTKLVLSDRIIYPDILGKYKNYDVAIEYDGFLWHRDKDVVKKDVQKTLLLIENGFRVIRIRENKLAMIPLSHPHLYQLNIPYSRKDKDLSKTVKLIGTWLNSQ